MCSLASTAARCAASGRSATARPLGSTRATSATRPTPPISTAQPSPGSRSGPPRSHASEGVRRISGRCPCCGDGRVLTEGGRPLPGAEFDHVFHRGLNRPERGWLVCRACHIELTHGGYLVRFLRMPEFRAFQAAVLEHRRRERTDLRAQAT